MIIFNRYMDLIKKISNIWTLLTLTVLILLINTIVFPLLMTKDVKPLDTRFYYPPKEAVEYDLQLNKIEKTDSLLMHGTVDLLYPIIYTLLLSCIIFYQKGSKYLVSLPLAALIADFLENIFIVLILYLSKQTIFYTSLTIGASIVTPLKWCSIILSFYVIIYLALRRIYEK